MASNNNPHENLSDQTPSDDFFDQILGLPNFSASSSDGGLSGGGAPPMMLQLGSGEEGSHMAGLGGSGPSVFHNQMFPLGLSLNQGKGHVFLRPEGGGVHASVNRSSSSSSSSSMKGPVRNQFFV